MLTTLIEVAFYQKSDSYSIDFYTTTFATT